jgi:hypothetical protein
MRLDIACGQNKQEGWTGIDIADCPGVDIRHDLRSTPWPIDSGVVEQAWCCHYFEHVPRLERPSFMSELWRVLVDGGLTMFVTPFDLFRQFQDFSHTWPVVPASFGYFNREILDVWGVGHYVGLYGINCNFEIPLQQAVACDKKIAIDVAAAIRGECPELPQGSWDLVTWLRKIPLEP